MASSGTAQLIVTLVHGTFAKHASWVERGATIGRALEARFGDGVAIESLRWSGRNTYSARREAAEKLRDHVLRERKGFEDARHIVVGHSHAGNVVCYAASDAAVRDRLAGVVTLATPFIVARRRNLGWTGTVMAQALVLWLVLGLFYWIDTVWGSAWGPWQKLSVFAVLAVLIEVPGLMLAERWARSSEVLLNQLNHATLPKEHILILRAVADEATGFITFLQLPSVIATLVIGKLAGIADRCVLWSERLVKRRIRAMAICVVAWIGSLAPAFLVFWLTGSKLWLFVTLIVFACLSFGPVIFLLLGNVHLALVTASLPLALLAAPFVLMLSLTLLAFGPRFALANMYLDISVEATPLGEYDVTLLSPSAAGDLNTPGHVLHSALYHDERAVNRIVDFAAARLH